MKVIKMISALLVSSISLVAPANAGEWDGTPTIANFVFNREEESQYIKRIIVRTGELIDNYAQTEVAVQYDAAACSKDSKLRVGMTVYLEDEIRNILGESAVYDFPREGEANEMIIQFDDVAIYPDLVSLDVRATCEPIKRGSVPSPYVGVDK
jgi:hypothetical protein